MRCESKSLFVTEREIAAKLLGLGYIQIPFWGSLLGSVSRMLACIAMPPDWELTPSLCLEVSVPPASLCRCGVDDRRWETGSRGRTQLRQTVKPSFEWLCSFLQHRSVGYVWTQWRHRVGLIPFGRRVPRGSVGNEHHQDHGRELGWSGRKRN